MALIASTARILRLFCALLAMLPWAGRAAEEPILRLADAIKRGDSAAVDQLLATGIDPNMRVPGAWLNDTVRVRRPWANRDPGSCLPHDSSTTARCRPMIMYS